MPAITTHILPTTIRRAIALGLFLIAVFHTGLAHAQRAAISVAPTRLAFDERTRSAELSVVNRGSETRVFRISLKHMKMTDDGRLVEAAPGEVQHADDFVRFSPRQVTLRPGVTQKVRVMARPAADSAPGEYRSHLLFQALPVARPQLPLETRDTGKLEMRLEIVGAVSIPLIVRHGTLKASATIAGASVEKGPDGEPTLRLKLTRSGNRSVYGDFSVAYFPTDSSDSIEVGMVRGIALYTPNEERTVDIALLPPRKVDLSAGRLVVVYREPPEHGANLISRVTIELD